MKKKAYASKIDVLKLLTYILKRSWLIILLAELGFASLYIHTSRMLPDTYTASGTMYVNNGSPNLSEYQYTNSGDLNSAVQLINTYLVVVKSDKVMSSVAEKLALTYPNIKANDISPTLSMASVSETGVVAVKSTTNDSQLAADIVNCVMEEAPDEIIRVVGAGSIEIIDHATVPLFPNDRHPEQKGMQGAIFGGVIAIAILVILFLANRRIVDTQDLTDNYTPPVLASIRRIAIDNEKADSFMLSDNSPMDVLENYAKLRMNLLYTLVDKEVKTVVITSSISGEGKSTIASNLAISCAMGGKKVLLVDGDMRRATQRDIFGFDKKALGLSEILVGSCKPENAILVGYKESMDLLPAGHFPPNPAELLGSSKMEALLKGLEQKYDLILLDMPPINIVSDPLAVSASVAGCLFITRQNFTDHRDIRKALISAEMTGMNVLGFVFYGEKINQGGYYSHRYYKNYYSKYDYRSRPIEEQENANDSSNNDLT